MLTDAAIRKAQPRAAPYRLSDGRGLTLLVKPTGSKLWRVRYRWQGRERVLAPGPYPEVSLAQARQVCDEARQALRDGLDPGVRRRRVGTAGETLRAVATRWWEDRASDWTPSFADDVWRSLELHVLPSLGEASIRTLTPLQLLSVLRPLVDEGKRAETVRRLRQRLSDICRLAVLEGLRQDDPAALLVDALPSPRVTPMRTIREEDVPALLAAVDRGGNSLVAAALRLQLLTATRPGEVRAAAWAEVDLAAAVWTIPADRMKRRRAHVVPLSRQALAVLSALQPVTGHRVHLFPGRLDRGRPMSNSAVATVLARAGWAERLTAHGLRSLFSTVCHERRLAEPDVIEHALAHVERSRTKRAYDRGDRLAARRGLMQAWADVIVGPSHDVPPRHAT
jgi:integrase